MGQSRTRLTLCAVVASAALVAAAAVMAATAAGHPTDAADVTATTPLITATQPTGTTATPAGTIAVDAACYVNTATATAKVTVTGAGWSPGDTVQLTDTRGVVTSTVTVSDTGAFTTTVPAPIVPTHDITVTDRIEAVDEGSQGSEGNAPAGGPTAYSDDYLTTDFAVRVADDSSPLRKLTFNLSGFTANQTVYGHYLTAAGRLLSTSSFGKPTGACGLRTVDAYEYPGGRAKRGAYVIQFDNDPRYSAHSTPQFRYSYVIARL